MTGLDVDAALRARADRSAPELDAAKTRAGADGRAAGARQRAAETKRRRTRAAILGAAGRLFDEQGGGATTMDQIAAEAGVSQAALYMHFPNKWQVAGAALGLALDGVTDLEAPYLAGLGPAAAVDRLLTEVMRVDAAHTSYTRVTVSALLETSRTRSRADLHQLQAVIPTVPTLTELIRRGQEAGVFHAYPAAPDAALLIVHVLVLHIALREEQPVEAVSHHVRTLAARLLGYEPPIAGGAGSPVDSGSS